jgi:hypothetical protein
MSGASVAAGALPLAKYPYTQTTTTTTPSTTPASNDRTLFMCRDVAYGG